MLRRLLAEDLESPGHTRPSSNGSTRRPAQVGVVEVRQAVRGGAHLAAHPAFFPREHAVVRAQLGEHHADRITVANHHPVDAAHLAGLCLDSEPARGADESKR